MAYEHILIVIDPQVGFCSPAGSLAQSFGRDALARITPALERIVSLLAAPSVRCEMALVRSEYRPGQFTAGKLDEPFSTACVPGLNADCDWAFDAALTVGCWCVTKHEHSAASVPEFLSGLSERINAGLRHVWLAGFLTTSCVRQTALDLRAALPGDISVGVIAPLTASRSANYMQPASGGVSRHDQVLAELRTAGVAVHECMPS